MDAPLGYGAQATTRRRSGYPGIAVKVGRPAQARLTQSPVPEASHTFFTSDTSPVRLFFASPNSIDVFWL